MDDDRKGLCREKAGFLFSHTCNNIAVGECSLCGKQVCEDHWPTIESVRLCTTCARKAVDDDARRATTKYDDYNPYFYSYRTYRGWGYYGAGCWGIDYVGTPGAGDSTDFTEADGESVRVEEETGFEQGALDS